MILADDEIVITKGLTKLLDWNSLGIEIIGTYSDGESTMEGILKEKPDLALLDISMPKMSGIDILKNIRDLELPTRVIFISGFQDFTYARNAVRYGAKDYLLKPVVEEELLSAIHKAIREEDGEDTGYEEEADISGGGTHPGDPEEETGGVWYLPVLSCLDQQVGTRQEQKLHAFAYASFLQDYYKDREDVTVFNKGEDVLLLIRSGKEEACIKQFRSLTEQSPALSGGRYCFILGNVVHSLSHPAAILEALLPVKKQLFFEEEEVAILYPEKEEEDAGALESLSRLREALMNDILGMKEEKIEQDFEQFARALKIASSGRREDANYYFCSSVRLLEEKLVSLHMTGKDPDTKSLLEAGRRARSFAEMKTYFKEYILDYTRLLKHSAAKEEQKDIQKIREYIDVHYRENLSLEVMAGEFYMNPYYFSAYFKKQTGTGFKEYVSYVRLQHAISLLLTTSMKTYEIAAQVGFSDARAFTDAFVKKYGETPAVYKKRILADQT